MTSKQRSALRAMANTMEPVLFIGINGITEATVKEAYDLLEKRELVPIGAVKTTSASYREQLFY